MKYLSYIFNFKTLEIQFLSLFRSSILLTALCLLVIETLLRLFVPEGHYPKGHWWNNEVRLRTYQLEQLSKIDIFFTGSSISSANIPPEAFDSKLRENDYLITSFNAGIRGCDFEGVTSGFKNIFWTRKQSEYVVLVISPFDLDQENRGMRKNTAKLIRNVNVPGYKAFAIDLMSNFWIFGFREEIREYLKTLNWLYEKPKVGIRGYTPMTEVRFGRIRDTVSIDKSGIVSKLLEFINELSQQNIKIVIVEAIMPSRLRQVMTPKKIPYYYELLEELKEINNVSVIRTEDITPPDKYFIDIIHLNPEGAHLYARSLAQKFISMGILENIPKEISQKTSKY